MDAKTVISNCERHLRRGDVDAFYADVKLLESIDVFTEYGYSFVHVAVSMKRPDVIRFLVRMGANCNLQEVARKATPLHYAVSEKDLECLKALLEGGADPNVVDGYGNPPLAHAVLKFRSDGPDLVRPLLDAGAEIDTMNRAGMSVRKHLARTPSEFILAPFKERGLLDGLDRVDSNPTPAPLKTSPEVIPLDGDDASVARWVWRHTVPAVGQSQTVQGELLRAVEKCRVEAKNNGNINFDASFQRLLDFVVQTLRKDPGFLEADKKSLRDDVQVLRSATVNLDAADKDFEKHLLNVYVEDDLYDRLVKHVVGFCRRHPQLIARAIDPGLDR